MGTGCKEAENIWKRTKSRWREAYVCVPCLFRTKSHNANLLEYPEMPKRKRAQSAKTSQQQRPHREDQLGAAKRSAEEMKLA